MREREAAEIWAENLQDNLFRESGGGKKVLLRDWLIVLFW